MMRTINGQFGEMRETALDLIDQIERELEGRIE
jgi:hypothetical protein